MSQIKAAKKFHRRPKPIPKRTRRKAWFDPHFEEWGR